MLWKKKSMSTGRKKSGKSLICGASEKQIPARNAFLDLMLKRKRSKKLMIHISNIPHAELIQMRRGLKRIKSDARFASFSLHSSKYFFTKNAHRRSPRIKGSLITKLCINRAT